MRERIKGTQREGEERIVIRYRELKDKERYRIKS